MMELLAAIDLRGGAAVRLVQGDFDREQGYGDPLALARRFADAGARWLHVVDLDAARSGRPVHRDTVVGIARQTGVPVQTGGGIRSEQDVAELLDAGVARVVLGTAALEDPPAAVRCARRFPDRVAVGLDYRRGPDGGLGVAVRGWTEQVGRSVAEVLEGLAEAPLAAVVVTAIDRDGTLSGPDLEGLAQVLDLTGVPVIASGGVGGVADVRALARLRSPNAGRSLAGVVTGKALVDGRMTVEEARAACAASA